MNDTEAQARMWADLLTAEMQARRAQHDVTRRAELYLHAGLPLERVLDALKVSRATWYRRVDSAREAAAQEPPTAADVQEGLRLLREQREWEAAEADRAEVQRLMYEQ